MDGYNFVIYATILFISVHLIKSCGEGWEKNDGVCYYFSKNITLSRDAAQARCEEIGGQLPSVTTKYINDYLRQEMLRKSTGDGSFHHWIGLVGTDLSQNKQEWRWLNGHFIADMPWYNDELWHDGEPSNESTVCGKIGHLEKTFGNAWCTNRSKYICETNNTDEDGELFQGHRYLFRAGQKEFMKAMHECFAINAYLATIEREEELMFIRNRTDAPENYWIGLTTLHWLGGSPITWSHFRDSNVLEGTNPKVYLHTSEDKWESTNDDNLQLRFICQKDMPVDPPTTSTSTTMATSASSTTPRPSTVSTTPKPSTLYTTPNLSSLSQKPTLDSTGESMSNDFGLITTVDTTAERDKTNTAMVTMNGNDMPMIAGIVVGIVIAVIIVTTVVFLLHRRRRRANLYIEKTHANEHCSTPSPENDDDIQPYAISDVVDDDLQPYGASKIQPYGISDMKTIEDNALNHKYESEGVSPVYDDVKFKDKKTTLIPPDVKQELPVYAVVNKPKGKADHTDIEGNSEHKIESPGKFTHDNDSLTINDNINNMPVYAVVDISKKRAANAKEGNAQQGNANSSENAAESVVKTDKDDTFADDYLPVYAVVDKTKKNAAYVPKQITDQQNQQEKQNINIIPTDGPIYAVVDKNKKVHSSKPIPPAKPSAIQTQNTNIDNTTTHIYSECENVKSTVGYAEFDIQEGAEESNKFFVDANHDYAEIQFKR